MDINARKTSHIIPLPKEHGCYLCKDILSIRFYQAFYFLSTFFYNYFASGGKGNHGIRSFFNQLDQIGIDQDLDAVYLGYFDHVYTSFQQNPIQYNCCRLPYGTDHLAETVQKTPRAASPGVFVTS